MRCPVFGDEARPHRWVEVRPGVRVCQCCNMLEYDVVGNVIHFPVGLSDPAGPSPVPRSDAHGHLLRFGHDRRKR